MEVLLRKPAVERYLRGFPQSQWLDCIEVTLMLGIETAQRMFPEKCTLESLAKALKTAAGTHQPHQRVITPDSGPTRGLSKEGNFEVLVQPMKRRGSSEQMETRPKSSQGRPSIPKSLKHVTSRIKADVQRDMERFFSPTKDDLEENQIEMKAKRQSDSEKKHYPPRPSLKQPSKGLTYAEAIREPRTNQAFVERLEAADTMESSVIRITNRFLADPLMTSLSNRPSPREYSRVIDFE